MNNEFTNDELKEVISSARVFCPSFSEGQYRDLMTLGSRLNDSGYLQAVHGLSQLEREKGVPCTRALDAFNQLLAQKEQLEGQLGDLKQKLAAQQNANREAERKFHQLNEGIEMAKQELQTIRTKRQSEEKELLAFKKNAESQRQRIDEDVAQYQDKARVTEEQVATAVQLITEVESRGFTLTLLLDLCQEFAGHENAREELSRALIERHTLSEYIANLKEEGEIQKKALKLDSDRLKSEKDRIQAEVNRLEEARSKLQSTLLQFRVDVGEQEQLRRFYSRYLGVSGLMECLASWEQIFFLRCNNPVSAMAGVLNRSAGAAHFWTDKPATRCPHCGLTMLIYDQEAYKVLNCPVGTRLRLQLGG